MEAIASDALAPGGSTVDNAWGGHQARITQHADGSTRILYLRNDASGNLTWRLMKRPGSTASWTQEATAVTTDDVNLLRDPVTDRAHVFGWSNSVPTAYTSPSFTPSTVPGTWQSLTSANRHYGSAGMAADGTACMTAVHDTGAIPVTSSVNTEYICGKYSTATGTWGWGPQIAQYTGRRSAYGYVFPGVLGDNTFLESTLSDLHKTVLNLTSLSYSYVFDGVRFFRGGMQGGSTFTQTNLLNPIYIPSTATTAVTTYQSDSYVDSHHRIISSYFVNDPNNTSARGMYATVADGNGTVLYQGRWPTLPTYGSVRVFEDAKGRMWVLWTGLGSATEMVLYPLTLTTSSTGSVTLSLGSPTNLGSAFSAYKIYANVRVAVPRNGQNVGNTIYGVMGAANTSTTHQVVHFAVRLPD